MKTKKIKDLEVGTYNLYAEVKRDTIENVGYVYAKTNDEPIITSPNNTTYFPYFKTSWYGNFFFFWNNVFRGHAHVHNFLKKCLF